MLEIVVTGPNWMIFDEIIGFNVENNENSYIKKHKYADISKKQ